MIERACVSSGVCSGEAKIHDSDFDRTAIFESLSMLHSITLMREKHIHF